MCVRVWWNGRASVINDECYQIIELCMIHLTVMRRIDVCFVSCEEWIKCCPSTLYSKLLHSYTKTHDDWFGMQNSPYIVQCGLKIVPCHNKRIFSFKHCKLHLREVSAAGSWNLFQYICILINIHNHMFAFVNLIKLSLRSVARSDSLGSVCIKCHLPQPCHKKALASD